MDERKPEICRLCLKAVVESYHYMNANQNDMIQIIVPCVNLDVCGNGIICEECYQSLSEAFAFKTSCLEIEDNIHDYTNDGTTQVNLEKVLGLEESDEEGAKICRTCLEVVDSDSYEWLIVDNKCLLTQMFQKFVPEMDLELTKYPVLCHTCKKSIKNNSSFVLQCMENEERIMDYIKTNPPEDFNLFDVQKFIFSEKEPEVVMNFIQKSELDISPEHKEEIIEFENNIFSGECNANEPGKENQNPNDLDDNHIRATENELMKNVEFNVGSRLSVEPTLNAQQMLDAEQMLNVQPILNIESTLSVEPVLHVEPMLHVEPVLNAEPVLDVEPTLNADPTFNAEPTLNAKPMLNVEPTLNIVPVLNAEPELNVEPASNVEPALNVEPMLNVEPILNVEPALSSEPLLNGEPALDVTKGTKSMDIDISRDFSNGPNDDILCNENVFDFDSDSSLSNGPNDLLHDIDDDSDLNNGSNHDRLDEDHANGINTDVSVHNNDFHDDPTSGLGNRINAITNTDPKDKDVSNTNLQNEPNKNSDGDIISDRGGLDNVLFTQPENSSSNDLENGNVPNIDLENRSRHDSAEGANNDPDKDIPKDLSTEPSGDMSEIDDSNDVQIIDENGTVSTIEIDLTSDEERAGAETIRVLRPRQFLNTFIKSEISESNQSGDNEQNQGTGNGRRKRKRVYNTRSSSRYKRRIIVSSDEDDNNKNDPDFDLGVGVDSEDEELDQLSKRSTRSSRSSNRMACTADRPTGVISNEGRAMETTDIINRNVSQLSEINGQISRPLPGLVMPNGLHPPSTNFTTNIPGNWVNYQSFVSPEGQQFVGVQQFFPVSSNGMFPQQMPVFGNQATPVQSMQNQGLTPFYPQILTNRTIIPVSQGNNVRILNVPQNTIQNENSSRASTLTINEVQPMSPTSGIDANEPPLPSSSVAARFRRINPKPSILPRHKTTSNSNISIENPPVENQNQDNNEKSGTPKLSERVVPPGKLIRQNPYSVKSLQSKLRQNSASSMNSKTGTSPSHSTTSVNSPILHQQLNVPKSTEPSKTYVIIRQNRSNLNKLLQRQKDAVAAGTSLQNSSTPLVPQRQKDAVAAGTSLQNSSTPLVPQSSRLLKNPMAFSRENKLTDIERFIEVSTEPSTSVNGESTTTYNESTEMVILSCKYCGFRAKQLTFMKKHLSLCRRGVLKNTPTNKKSKKASPKNAAPNKAPPNKAPPNRAPPNKAPPNKAPPNKAPPNKAPPNKAPPTKIVSKKTPAIETAVTAQKNSIQPPLKTPISSRKPNTNSVLLLLSNKPPFTCDLCGYSSISQNIYNMHQLICPKLKMMKYNQTKPPEQIVNEVVDSNQLSSKPDEVITIDDESISESSTNQTLGISNNKYPQAKHSNPVSQAYVMQLLNSDGTYTSLKIKNKKLSQSDVSKEKEGQNKSAAAAMKDRSSESNDSSSISAGNQNLHDNSKTSGDEPGETQLNRSCSPSATEAVTEPNENGNMMLGDLPLEPDKDVSEKNQTTDLLSSHCEFATNQIIQIRMSQENQLSKEQSLTNEFNETVRQTEVCDASESAIPVDPSYQVKSSFSIGQSGLRSTSVVLDKQLFVDLSKDPIISNIMVISQGQNKIGSIADEIGSRSVAEPAESQQLIAGTSNRQEVETSEISTESLITDNQPTTVESPEDDLLSSGSLSGGMQQETYTKENPNHRDKICQNESSESISGNQISIPATALNPPVLSDVFPSSDEQTFEGESQMDTDEQYSLPVVKSQLCEKVQVHETIDEISELNRTANQSALRDVPISYGQISEDIRLIEHSDPNAAKEYQPSMIKSTTEDRLLDAPLTVCEKVQPVESSEAADQICESTSSTSHLVPLDGPASDEQTCEDETPMNVDKYSDLSAADDQHSTTESAFEDRIQDRSLKLCEKVPLEIAEAADRTSEPTSPAKHPVVLDIPALDEPTSEDQSLIKLATEERTLDNSLALCDKVPLEISESADKTSELTYPAVVSGIPALDEQISDDESLMKSATEDRILDGSLTLCEKVPTPPVKHQVVLDIPASDEQTSEDVSPIKSATEDQTMDDSLALGENETSETAEQTFEPTSPAKHPVVLDIPASDEPTSEDQSLMKFATEERTLDNSALCGKVPIETSEAADQTSEPRSPAKHPVVSNPASDEQISEDESLIDKDEPLMDMDEHSDSSAEDDQQLKTEGANKDQILDTSLTMCEKMPLKISEAAEETSKSASLPNQPVLSAVSASDEQFSQDEDMNDPYDSEDNQPLITLITKSANKDRILDATLTICEKINSLQSSVATDQTFRPLPLSYPPVLSDVPPSDEQITVDETPMHPNEDNQPSTMESVLSDHQPYILTVGSESSVNQVENDQQRPEASSCDSTDINESESSVNQIENDQQRPEASSCDSTDINQSEPTANRIEKDQQRPGASSCDSTDINESESSVNQKENDQHRPEASSCDSTDINESEPSANRIEKDQQRPEASSCDSTDINDSESSVNQIENDKRRPEASSCDSTETSKTERDGQLSGNVGLENTKSLCATVVKPKTVCPQKFEIPKDLAILKCDSCSFNTRNHFRMESHVLTHLARYRKNNIYFCTFCNLGYGNAQLFYEHLKVKHYLCNYKVFFWCVCCAMVFRQKPDMVRHCQTCTQKDKIVRLFKSNLAIFCMMCDFETNEVNLAKTHLQVCREKNAVVLPDVIEID